jgi:tryptophan synthase alpha chain
MAIVSLIAPTTSESRIGGITENTKGFLYYISVTGVTGTDRPDVEVLEWRLSPGNM